MLHTKLPQFTSLNFSYSYQSTHDKNQRYPMTLVSIRNKQLYVVLIEMKYPVLLEFLVFRNYLHSKYFLTDSNVLLTLLP